MDASEALDKKLKALTGASASIEDKLSQLMGLLQNAGLSSSADSASSATAAPVEAARRSASSVQSTSSSGPVLTWLDEALPETLWATSDGMKNTDCPVCLENLHERAKADPTPEESTSATVFRVRTLPCGHGGCSSCIASLLLTAGTLAPDEQRPLDDTTFAKGKPCDSKNNRKKTKAVASRAANGNTETSATSVSDGITCPLCRTPVDSGTKHRALLQASTNGDTLAVRKLLRSIRPEHGSSGATLASVDISVPGAGGSTPLMLAAAGGHSECISLLLAAGASPNLADEEGGTALLRAAWGCHTQAVTALLETGAAVNYADTDGETALMVSGRLGDIDTARALLSGGADPSLKDSNGWTASQKAGSRRHEETAKLIHAANNYDYDALD
ncbi:hypothetical protein CYMTET_24644 [Cymbomonas tetramitiformis]|uniref:RING-type domain-containing protein n=1 Tax=Cymbomonas tetramitiformis TaxID=36881 RepID=A0AAE0FVW4_9CHLO|nr:hypothetical protein CYMTET_24644 [Cymbomonas tetramitiformis]|eukprot:gene11246-13292_t